MFSDFSVECFIRDGLHSTNRTKSISLTVPRENNNHARSRYLLSERLHIVQLAAASVFRLAMSSLAIIEQHGIPRDALRTTDRRVVLAVDFSDVELATHLSGELSPYGSKLLAMSTPS